MEQSLVQAVFCSGVLFLVILPTFLIAAYCLRRNTSSNTVTDDLELSWANEETPASNVDYEGLESNVLEGLPVFRYKSQEEQLCSVCLSDFVDSDIVKLLPDCNHYFHKDCIDVWFRLHTCCPVCRTRVEPNTSSCILDMEKDHGRDAPFQEQPICSPDAVEDQVVVSNVDQRASGARPLPQIAIPLAHA